MYKGVIFDIDGTLYDYQSNDVQAMKNLCAFVEKNLGVDEKTFRETYTQAQKIIRGRLKDTAAQHSRILLIQTALELLGKNPFDYVLQMYDVYWNCFLENMQPYDGAADFLRGLKNFGVKVSVCTDMTAQIQYRKLIRLGLDKFIDFMVTSEETGFEKPAPIMFNMALQKMNVRADEAAYFGDTLDRDIQGAASVGIEPFWFVADREIIGGDEFKKIRSYRDDELKIFFRGD
ncbi:MAG: HAD-IA family hydrolase [Selenomonadaceae bacterium]|nr:HAD-IA family hydrolase [Selenomonadaceae bacterium]